MYSKTITKTNKSLIVLALDRSGSMAGRITVGRRIISKAELLSEVSNDLIAELVERSRRAENVSDYYDIVVLGYSGNGVESLIDSDSWLSIVDMENSYLDEREVMRDYKDAQGNIGMFEYREQRWVLPAAAGKTPMYEALITVYDIVEEWLAKPENQESFPPIIFNITDGNATDCSGDDIIEISSKIKSLSTYDGNAILFNVHLTSSHSNKSIIFPSFNELTFDRCCSNATLSLFYAASEIPPQFVNYMRNVKESDKTESYKAMSYNCSAGELFGIMNIGSRTVKCF